MAQMKFPSKWRSWVMATLYSARASVLVNGSPTREFDCSRGLRQGDPLSPFLFVIVMEALTCVMKKVVSIDLFKCIDITARGPLSSHLIYANVMFMVNLAKCSIYGIRVREHEVQQMVSHLRCKQAPIKVLDALDKIRRVFFWGGSEEKAKMNWVAWEKTIAPVEYGGLGFGSIRDANLAMLAKWWWRFKTEKNSLWRRVIWAIHHNTRAWNDIPVKISIAGLWKSIISIRQFLLNADIDLRCAICASLVNGKNIQFWLDSWADPVPLYIKFSDLFKEERFKDYLVEDRLGFDESGPVFSWAWARPSLGDSEHVQLQQLEQMVSGLNMGSGRDCWTWKYDSNGIFNVAGIKKILSMANRVSPARVFEWNNWIPKKVAIVAWRAEMERLPTKCVRIEGCYDCACLYKLNI
ncbi:uncharacterized protein LOC110907548 [Helianthus annuus]|uniref:uncharacterized protein LOC110907548 n=1 Tax=Helianthus annuus TaxID=4232 RepID=UPI000B909784|nr:uncharacterized protein LOC110907548 [Helianthus annuus]